MLTMTAPFAPAFLLDHAVETHAGLVRPLNEDAAAVDTDAGLYVLADGLGGYNAGEIASTMTVSALLNRLPASLAGVGGRTDAVEPADWIVEAMDDINASVYNAAISSTAYEGMATTVVLAWFIGPALWVAHVGDSRVYRLRGGELEQLTRDHSLSQELLDAGVVTEEEARNLPAKNLVTRAVGAAADLETEVHEHDVRTGDVLLLCSDGLTEMVEDFDIESVLAEHPDEPAAAARALVELANENGGRDNVTVVVIHVGNEAAAPA